MSKSAHSKKDCINLINEKNLQLSIRRIGQTDRLIDESVEHGLNRVSEPIFSWDRLFVKLEALPSEQPAVVEAPDVQAN